MDNTVTSELGAGHRAQAEPIVARPSLPLFQIGA